MCVRCLHSFIHTPQSFIIVYYNSIHPFQFKNAILNNNCGAAAKKSTVETQIIIFVEDKARREWIKNEKEYINKNKVKRIINEIENGIKEM